jgi:hypothetical protein
MGPGTHVIERILKQVKPANYVDALALKHDIAYLQSGEQFLSDLEAAWRADYTIEGNLMRFGLLSRTLIDAVTHVLPVLPNFHLNLKQSLPDNVIADLKQRANPMLKPYGLEYQGLATVDLLDDYHYVTCKSRSMSGN